MIIKWKPAILTAVAILCFNGCENISINTPETIKIKTVKSKLSKKTKIIIKATGFPNRIVWHMQSGDTSWFGSLVKFSLNHKSSFSFENQSLDTMDETGRKTTRIVSHPFTIGPDRFICIQEASTVKGFPGVLFRIRMRNIGKYTVPAADIQFFFSMKEKTFSGWKGKQEVTKPWTRFKKLKNWIFMPNSKGRGLALITNFSTPGLMFTSNFRRIDKKGKVIDDLLKSKWGIRNLYQHVASGKESELLFVLVPADSPEETVGLCEKLEKEKIFPELKLESGDYSIQKTTLKKREIKITKKKVKVKPLFNSKYYSAGKLDAKAVDSWVEKNICLELYDIWYGKKERINLNGSWKLLKLGGTQDAPNCEYGIKHGFEKMDFNDVDWLNQPVPFLWNTPLEKIDKGKTKRKIFFGGVGWYRRKFKISKNYFNKRMILCCPGIEQEATIYVNGRKAAFHKTISFERGAWAPLHQLRYEYFEVDITPYLKFGAENIIAIRIYDDGDIWGHIGNAQTKKDRKNAVPSLVASGRRSTLTFGLMCI